MLIDIRYLINLQLIDTWDVMLYYVVLKNLLVGILKIYLMLTLPGASLATLQKKKHFLSYTLRMTVDFFIFRA